jgi:hypothetical protein
MAKSSSEVSNPSSALGEAVGKLFERGVIDCLKSEVAARGHSIRPSRLTNGTGNTYQIDAVVYDQDDKPIIIIEPKYIRYTKHNRDKGSWLCTAHYNLRKSHPTIRKSIAVLGGRWSTPSKALMSSFGVQLFEVAFQEIVDILYTYDVAFDWPERNAGEWPRRAWNSFLRLGQTEHEQLSQELVTGIQNDLIDAVTTVLDTDISTLPRRISSVEVLMKTEQDEIVLKTFDSVATAIQDLSGYITDRADIGDLPG